MALAGIVLQGAAAGGFGLGEALHWDVVSAVLGTRFGTVWLLQAGLALACAVLLVAGRRVPVLTIATLAPAAVLLLTPALSGHASVSGKIAFVTDVAHVTSAAVWVGGLAALVLALLWAGEDRWPLAADAVPRFSGIAVVAVSWLIASGTISGYLQVRALRGLWETTYGQLLLLKLGLVLPLLLLGLYNNRRAVPRLREQIASAGERTRFLRIAGAELALMVAIVSVTAVLVSEPPARAEVAPTGPYATIAQLGDLELNLVVDPSSLSHSPAASSGRPVADGRDRPRRAGDRLRACQPGRPCSPRDSLPCSPSTARSGERRSATCSSGWVTDAIR